MPKRAAKPKVNTKNKVARKEQNNSVNTTRTTRSSNKSPSVLVPTAERKGRGNARKLFTLPISSQVETACKVLQLNYNAKMSAVKACDAIDSIQPTSLSNEHVKAVIAFLQHCIEQSNSLQLQKHVDHFKLLLQNNNKLSNELQQLGSITPKSSIHGVRSVQEIPTKATITLQINEINEKEEANEYTMPILTIERLLVEQEKGKQYFLRFLHDFLDSKKLPHTTSIGTDITIFVCIVKLL